MIWSVIEAYQPGYAVTLTYLRKAEESATLADFKIYSLKAPLWTKHTSLSNIRTDSAMRGG